MNLRVTLLNQPKYLCCGGISPSIASQRRWRRLPHSMICIACFHIQSTSNQHRPTPSNQWHEALCQCQHRGEFLGSSQIDEQHDPMYVSLLDGNIEAAPLPSTLPSLQRTTAKGSCIQLHMAATPSTTAQKQVCNTLGNYVYISKFTKCISCSWTCRTRHFHTWLGNNKAICSRYLSLKT